MTLVDDTRGFRHRFVATGPADRGGVRLHIVTNADEAPRGPLVLLLHGFPECWATWRHVLRPLADAGFTICAPDLRGYNTSDKPTRVEDYRVQRSVDDVAGLIRALGYDKAHVVGHDWGGAVAWHVGQRQPELAERLVVLNSPHPAIFLRRMMDPQQLSASGYIFFFQIPGVAEAVVRARDFRLIEEIFRRAPRRPHAYDDEDIAVMKDALRQEGALTGALNWYRAALRQALAGRRRGAGSSLKRAIEVPTLVIHGLDDRALPPGNLDGLRDCVQELRVVTIPQCSHWVTHDAPEIVVREILDFLPPAR
jgi:epoxide hydrolase 4